MKPFAKNNAMPNPLDIANLLSLLMIGQISNISYTSKTLKTSI